MWHFYTSVERYVVGKVCCSSFRSVGDYFELSVGPSHFSYSKQLADYIPPSGFLPRGRRCEARFKVPVIFMATRMKDIETVSNLVVYCVCLRLLLAPVALGREVMKILSKN